jgi:ribonuclease HII
MNHAHPDSLTERLRYEREARAQGYRLVAGIDEAGRGPLAGPVVAACVLLPDDPAGLEAVRDSKEIKAGQRAELFALLHARALAIGVGVADHLTIDRINILQATFLAMRQAVEHVQPQPDFLLIDGNRRPRWAEAAAVIVDGDRLSLSIAAASIIAKVTRDRMMEEFSRVYPEWGFDRHKGYGTPEHLAAIRRHGICELHRRSFFPVSQMSLALEE